MFGIPRAISIYIVPETRRKTFGEIFIMHAIRPAIIPRNIESTDTITVIFNPANNGQIYSFSISGWKTYMWLRYVKGPSKNRSGKTFAEVGGMGFQQGLQDAIFKFSATFIYRGNAFPIIVTCCDQIVHLKTPLNRLFVLRKHEWVLWDT